MRQIPIMANNVEKMKQKIAVKTESLVKYYGRNKALDGLSINVPENSIYGLVGPNGAGKTTTLGILSTFVKPASGRAEIFGQDIINDPDKARGLIGILPQRANLYDNRTAIDIMVLYSKLAGFGSKEAVEY